MARLFGRLLFLVTALYCILCSSSAVGFLESWMTSEEREHLNKLEDQFEKSRIPNGLEKSGGVVVSRAGVPHKIKDHVDSAASKVQDGLRKFGGALFGPGNSVPAAATAVPEITMISIIIGWVVARNIGV